MNIDSILSKANKEASKYWHAAKSYREQLAKLQAEHEATRQEIAKLQASKSNEPNELQSEVARLKRELAIRDTRSIFDEVATEAGVRAEAKAAAWKLAEYDVTDTPLPKDALATKLTDVLEKNPFLRSEVPLSAKDKLNVATPATKGSTIDTSSKRQVRLSDTQDPQWMRKNQTWLTDALKKDEVEFIQ